MAGKVEQGWFKLFLAADAQRAAAVARGENRSEATRVILREQNQIRRNAGKKALQEQSFERIMKAGRFLRDLKPALDVDQVKCGYVQIELLSRINRHSPSSVAAILPQVLMNEMPANELQRQLDELKQADPLAHALANRNSVRSITASHEKNCQKALETTGPNLFGSCTARIWKQEGSYPAVTPNFFVTDNEKILAGIFSRVGSKSKDALAAAFELYFLANNYREVCTNIWIILPERSAITRNLAFLAVKLGGAPTSGGWLKVAILDDNEITAFSKGDYGHAQLVDDIYGGSKIEFKIPVKELITGERLRLSAFPIKPGYEL